MLAAGNVIPALSPIVNGNAMAGKGVHCHIHVALRFQRCGALQDGVFFRQGKGEEKACEELGAHIAGKFVEAAGELSGYLQRKASLGMV